MENLPDEPQKKTPGRIPEFLMEFHQKSSTTFSGSFFQNFRRNSRKNPRRNLFKGIPELLEEYSKEVLSNHFPKISGKYSEKIPEELTRVKIGKKIPYIYVICQAKNKGLTVQEYYPN